MNSSVLEDSIWATFIKLIINIIIQHLLALLCCSSVPKKVSKGLKMMVYMAESREWDYLDNSDKVQQLNTEIIQHHTADEIYRLTYRDILCS